MATKKNDEAVAQTGIPSRAPTGMAMFTIARRELASYFNSPLAYVVICLSQVLLGVTFFEQAGFFKVGRATLENLFYYSGMGLGLLVVPVVTMRTVAEERATGTIEMLITLPVSDWEVILGKYLAALGLVVILILSTFIYPLTMFRWPWKLGAIDMGPVWAGYIGLFLVAAAAVAVGLLISSLTRSQVIAFFITFAVMAALFVAPVFAEKWVSPQAGTVLGFIGFPHHLAQFARGLIDTRAIVYFLSITVFSLMVAFRALEARKWQ